LKGLPAHQILTPCTYLIRIIDTKTLHLGCF